MLYKNTEGQDKKILFPPPQKTSFHIFYFLIPCYPLEFLHPLSAKHNANKESTQEEGAGIVYSMNKCSHENFCKCKFTRIQKISVHLTKHKYYLGDLAVSSYLAQQFFTGNSTFMF